MRQRFLWLVIVGVLLAVFWLYRSQSGSGLHVTPDAQKEIDKAKRR